ncbi:hypothetical protein [Rhodalgimonas zhirmunskyi]|uniref:Tetratricopeptide repeat protein n=1 Tax=Rhodalgimonas zhirmunskyi TaxID=2964767 RepID=A0AAJ1X5B1_9RHOB|nr:hypothetical protein [Rhodoalgimonas zhirmunskyi]MDQ2093979.1 hypothetical protein [Rhodoalgimonas zhirmunskyi]
MTLRAKFALALYTFLIGTAQHAAAVEIPVRAAEHEGFTRVVLDLPHSVLWRVESLKDRRRIELDGIDPEFNLKNSFRRITTDRVLSLSMSPDRKGLDIFLNCECEVETFLHDNRMLVIDIKSSSPSSSKISSVTSAKPANLEFAPAYPNTFQRRFRFPFETRNAPSPGLEIDLTSTSSQTQEVSEKSGSSSEEKFSGSKDETSPGMKLNTLTEGELPFVQNKPDVAETLRLSLAEKHLAEQLGRAATQGLVKPKTQSNLPRPYPKEPNGEDSILPIGTQPNGQPKTFKQPDINVRATTSADTAFLAFANAAKPARDGNTCLKDGELAIETWGEEGQFASGIGRLRRLLSEEFDRTNTEIATRLAKSYLYYGFGAEARRALEQSALSGPEALRLMAMSDVLEFGYAQNPTIFNDQYDCDGNAALWAVLSKSVLPSNTTPDVKAIARAINSMPPRLRQLLGPIASDRLIGSGYDEAAAQILKLVERGMSNRDSAYEMANAKLKLAEGEAKSAEQSLNTVVNSNSALSPKALIDLVDTRLKQNIAIDTELSDLISAYAQEYRRGNLGAELQRVHILALSATGKFEEALETMEEFTKTAPPDSGKRLRSHAMEALAVDADDVTFLKYAVATDASGHRELDPAAGNAVAQRLIGLGFPSEARAYLRDDVSIPFKKPRALLRARAALATDRPALAEAELIGVDGEESDLIRAQARSEIGDHSAAARMFSELSKKTSAAEQAWLASNWDELKQADPLLWQDITSLIEEGPTGVSEPLPSEGPLARDRALLEKSASARRAMDSLLARVALEPGPKASE